MDIMIVLFLFLFLFLLYQHFDSNC